MVPDAVGVAAIAHPRPQHDEAAHRRDANRAVGVSALGLALTGGIELALAIVTGSVALLGDALHNLSDVSTSAVVFMGFRISKRKPTTGYPYGYERAEDLAGLGVALVIWGSAVFAGVESYLKLVGNGGTSHVGIGMAAAVLGIVGFSRPRCSLMPATPGSMRSRPSVRSSAWDLSRSGTAGGIQSPASP
jgi:cation diffusion facilitator family transporter